MSAIVPPEAGAEWTDVIERRRSRTPVVVARRLGLYYDLETSAERSLGHVVRTAISRAKRRRFWALRDVDLTVREGDCVAVIGRNGAGKSSLLQVIAGLIEPDEGVLRTRGRISALLNLGVGFDPRLTGRENVELLGALMGLRGSTVRQRTPDVLEFAELGSFIDAPLRTYSSGMRARLGFAAATMIDPHILVLDEVIGTGDATFREKSRARLMSFVDRAHAVITATHDMTWVAEFASYGVLLDNGSIVADGAPAAVAAYYRARSSRPSRAYGCAACGSEPAVGYCTACGLRRLSGDRHKGEVPVGHSRPYR